MAITNGKYKARANGEVVLGKSAEKKTPFIELYFVITEGENAGGEVRWTGYFSEKTAERTIQSLQHCGWQGEDPSEFADGDLHGLDANEVEIVVELEEYEKDGERRTAPRVQWVNRLGGYLNVQNAMSKDEAKSFGESMRGLVLKMKKKAPPPNPGNPGTDFNFGANANQSGQAEKAAAAGQRKGW